MIKTWNNVYSILYLLLYKSEAIIQLAIENKQTFLDTCVIKVLNEIESTKDFKDVTLINASNELGKALNDLQKYRFLIRSFLWEKQKAPNEVYLIISEHYYALYDEIDELKQDSYWNPRAIFIIIINDVIELLQEISSLLLYNHMYNVIIVTRLNKTIDDYSIFGFSPEIDDCNIPKVKVLQFISNCSSLNKISALIFKGGAVINNCKVKLYARLYEPFYYFPQPSGIRGIEEYILKLWSQTQNITIDFVNTGSGPETVYLLSNYTDSNIVIYNDTNDAIGIFGGFSLNIKRRTILEYSYPYMIDHEIIITARTPDLEKWEAIMNDLSLSIAILLSCLFLIFCILSSYLLIFVKKRRDIVRDILIVYGYFLTNISVKRCNPNFVARIVFLSLLIFVFLMSNIVQAFLLSASTRPIAGHQVNDLEIIYKTFKPILLRAWKWKFSHKLNDTEYCDEITTCIEKVINSNELAFTLVSDTYYNILYYDVIDNLGQVQLYRVREPEKFVYRVIYFSRGSTAISSMNRHVRLITESGLLSHHIQLMEYLARVKSKVKSHAGYDPTDLSEIKEPFIVLIIGYFLSIIVFVYECRCK
ncbi:uncharacterized protein LOC131842865 [Achroia grisella]|uniref:uncharacterized protein LOC131842865 n=1 Tax=Achroia grisella TaxID=688607 RepID=UPI0027D33F19|nr:uncharacterized protein LOC131842865 [Achroia grisella]